MKRLRKLTMRIAIVSMFVTGLAAVGVAISPAATAADSCGDGWHKQSDGLLNGDDYRGRDSRTISARVDGYVRFCTRERSLYDQRNQKIIVSLPETVISRGTYSGLPRSAPLCFTQKIEIFADNVVTSRTLEGNVSGGPGAGSVGFTLSETYSSTKAQFVRKLCRTVGNGNDFELESRQFSVQVDNGSSCYPTMGGGSAGCFSYPVISKIVVTTSTQTAYKVDGTTKNLDAIQVETDVPN